MGKIVKRTVDMDDKKCPFNQSAAVMYDCMRQDCALWLDEASQCSIPVLARLSASRTPKIALVILAIVSVVSGGVGIYAVLIDRPVIGMGLVYLFIIAYVLFNQWKEVSPLKWKEVSQLKKAALVAPLFVIMPVFAFTMWLVFVGQSWLSGFFFEWPGAALSPEVTAVLVLAFFLMGFFVVLPWLSGLISDLGIYHASNIECFEEKCMRVGFVYGLISVPLIISYLMYLRTLNMQFDWKGAVLVIISTMITLLIIRVNSNPSKEQIKRPSGVPPEDHGFLIKTHKERMLSFLFSLIFAQWIFSIIALATVIRQDSAFTFGTEPLIVGWFIVGFFISFLGFTIFGEGVLSRWIRPDHQIRQSLDSRTSNVWEKNDGKPEDRPAGRPSFFTPSQKRKTMLSSRRYLIMLNDKIRKHILEYYYAKWMAQPTLSTSCAHLAEELGIKRELLAANVIYLHEEGLLQGSENIQYPERSIYRITALGIKAVEHPEGFFTTIPFLQLFMGDVTGSTITQAREIRVENGLYTIFRQMEHLDVSSEVRAAVAEIEQETQKQHPDCGRIKDLLQKVKADDRIFSILSPVVSDFIKTWLIG